MKHRVFTILLLGLLALPVAAATTYWCDPVSGSNCNSGADAEHAWGSLQSITTDNFFEPAHDPHVSDGDTVKLLTGDHGIFDCATLMNQDSERKRSSYIYIEADTGAVPYLERIWLNAATYWWFKGIYVSPSYYATAAILPRDPSDGEAGTPPIIFTGTSGYNCAAHIGFEDCVIFTVLDSSRYSHWAIGALLWDGIGDGGYYMTIHGCTFLNVARPIVCGPYSVIEENLFINWSHDVMFVGGTDLTVQNNRGYDAYQADGQEWAATPGGLWHSDFLQTGDAAVTPNLTALNNICRGSTLAALGTTYGRPGQQGIFLESKDMDNVLIANNVMSILNEAHGITIGSGENAGTVQDVKIYNNTLLHWQDGASSNFPDVTFQTSHTTFSNIDIQNNIAGAVPANNPPTVLASGNAVLNSQATARSEFVDYDNAVLMLQSTSNYADAGNTIGTLTTDVRGLARGYNGSYDQGAYEYRGESGVAPTGASSLSPPDEEAGVAVQPTLSWTPSGQAEEIWLYLGSVDPPKMLMVLAGDATSYTLPGPLATGVTYYWNVAEASVNGVTRSATRSFTTTGSVVALPNAASSPSIPSGSSLSLSGQTVTFTADAAPVHKQVFFGKSNIYANYAAGVNTWEGTFAPWWNSGGTDVYSVATGTLDASRSYVLRVDCTNMAGTTFGTWWEYRTPDAPQSLPYSQTFNGGMPNGNAGWEYYSSGGGGIGTIASDGSLALRMQGDTVAGDYELNECILHLNLTGYTDITLTLDHKTFSDGDDAMSAAFSGHENSDGIAASVDGTNWAKVADFTTTYDGGEYSLDSALATAKTLAGTADASNTRLKFQAYSNYVAPTDGREIDNVSITGTQSSATRYLLIRRGP
jgi:hypothetical protein